MVIVIKILLGYILKNENYNVVMDIIVIVNFVV